MASLPSAISESVMRSTRRCIRASSGRSWSSARRSACASARPRLGGTISGFCPSTMIVCRTKASDLSPILVSWRRVALSSASNPVRRDSTSPMSVLRVRTSSSDSWNEMRFCDTNNLLLFSLCAPAGAGCVLAPPPSVWRGGDRYGAIGAGGSVSKEQSPWKRKAHCSVRQQAGHVRILLLPQPVHPLLEAGTERAVVLVVATQQLIGDRALAQVHADLGDAVRQQVHHRGPPAGIRDGHVQDRVQALAHRVQHESHAARLRLEQVAVRRALRGVLARREA